MNLATKLLIVEDDYEIARIMIDHLRSEGYDVTCATTGAEGWEDFKADTFDLIIVDLMLPEIDGFELCERIRLESDLPILLVSARQEDDTKIRGLNMGADDYLTKPFSLQELSARVRSHLRRYHRYLGYETGHSKTFYKNDLVIDYTQNLIYLDEEILNLTLKEQEILLLLSKNPLITFEKKKIYEHVWQQLDVDGNNTVTVHIRSIRQKLKDTDREAKFIQTVWGVGYRFVGEEL